VRTFAFCVLALALASCAKKTGPTGAPEPAPAPGPSAVSDRDRAQGAWKVAKLEWPNGTRPPMSPEMTEHVTVTVAGDRATLTMKGDENDSLYVVFTEDAGKAPRQVNFIATDGPNSREPRKHKTYGVGKDGKPVVISEFAHPPLKAIYKFEGDALIVALPVDPDSDRPTEFKPAMVKLPENRGGLDSTIVVIHLKKK
jgi:uncharacterized protein (TIGR03067 family)